MLPQLHIPMPSRGDVEIPLHFIPIQRPKNPTTIRHPLHPRRLRKLLPLPRRAQLIVHIPQLLPPGQPIIAHSERMNSLLFIPLAPTRRVLPEHFTSEGSIAGRVLHVDVEIGAAHGDHDIDIDLHVVRDTFFDGEGLRGGAGEPAGNFGPGEVDTC